MVIKLINEKPYKFPQPGNSLADRYPELIKEWDNEKNTPLTPKMVAPFSNRYAYWKCVNNMPILLWTFTDKRTD